MSSNPKITIEKRIFKLNDNENFILEYPSNYEEIANKKLTNLQKEYDKAQINKNTDNNLIDNDINYISSGNNENEINKEKEVKKITSNETGENKKLNNENDNYYIKIKNYPLSIGDKEEELKQNTLDKEKNVKLEPQHGYIQINLQNKIKEESNNKEEEEEIFYEVKENEYGNNIGNENVDFKNEKNENNKDNRNISPVKNVEGVKNAMRSIKLKPPEWAKNITEKDFISMAKNIISSKKKNSN